MKAGITFSVLAISAIAAFSGCGNGAAWERFRQADLRHNEWRVRSTQVSERLGEKVFEKDADTVFRAAVIGVSSVGGSVKVTDKDGGMIMAESSQTLMAQNQDEANLFIKRINSECPMRFVGYGPNGNWYVEQPGEGMTGNGRDVAILVQPQSPQQTKVKIRIKRIKGGYHNTDVLYPPLLEREFAVLWQAIERQLFLDENLD